MTKKRLQSRRRDVIADCEAQRGDETLKSEHGDVRVEKIARTGKGGTV